MVNGDLRDMANGELALPAPERGIGGVAIAAKKRQGRSPGVLEWNVVLRGENETVFFDY